MSLLKSTLFVSTGDQTITNTTDETTVFDGGVGTRTIPANELRIGSTYQVRAWGRISGTINHQATLRVKLGSVTLATSVANLPASLSNAAFEALFEFTVRSVGSSGTVIGQGRILIGAGTGIVTSYIRPIQMLTTATIDTTIANTFDATYQWGTVDAGDIAVITNSVFEIKKR